MKAPIANAITRSIIRSLRQPKKGKEGKVYLPKFFLILGLIGFTFFFTLTLITAFSNEPTWVWSIFLFFSLFGVALIVAFINCRITYDETGFVAKNFFGIKRRFTYDQVTAIKENMHETYICIDKKKVMIDEFAIGEIEFVAVVKEEYKRLHDGQSLPPVPKNKHDIFNGNVKDVSGFIVAYVLMGAITVAFLIFTVWYTYFTPSTEENTLREELTFQSFDAREDTLILTSDSHQIYKVRFVDEKIDRSKIESLCDEATVVTVYSVEVTPKNENDYYSVKAIFDKEECILSFEDTNRLHQQEYWKLILFAGIINLAWGAFVAMSIVIGRNPRKFSKKVVKLFFKDGYIKY